jgi:hypothetical protein
MKAEHRHQLHTNALAEQMNRLVKGVRSTPKSTSVTIWVIVGIVIAAIIVWQVYSSRAAARSSRLWLSVDAALHDPARGLEELGTLASEDTGTLPSRTARFDLARVSFQQAQAGLLSPDGSARAAAINSLKQSQEIYEKLASECADSPLLAQEAMMGVAAAREALAGVTTPGDPQKDLEDAKNAYRQLAEKYPQSPLGQAAKERADAIQEKVADYAKFYAELHQSTPAAKPETK